MQVATSTAVAGSVAAPTPLVETRHVTSVSSQSTVPSSAAPSTGISYGLGHGLGAGTAIAAAASQAIAATQQVKIGYLKKVCF